MSITLSSISETFGITVGKLMVLVIIFFFTVYVLFTKFKKRQQEAPLKPSQNMTEEEKKILWGRFVELITKLNKKNNREVRMNMATHANMIAKYLLASKYVLSFSDDQQSFWLASQDTISRCLDSKTEVIQGAVREYFAWYLHDLERHEYELTFNDKIEGNSQGTICTLKNLKSPISTIRFFVKSYQDAISPNRLLSSQPNAREILIYKFLQLLDIGGEAHFIVDSRGTTRSLYIATKEVKYKKLSILDEDSDIMPLIAIDYLSRVLRLDDVGMNPSNCGVNVLGHPVIIDFKTIQRSTFVISDKELMDYFNGICGGASIDNNYHHLMKKAVQAPKEVKLAAIKTFFNEDLRNQLDASLVFTNDFCKNWERTLVRDGIKEYVSAVKQNIIKFESFLTQ